MLDNQCDCPEVHEYSSDFGDFHIIGLQIPIFMIDPNSSRLFEEVLYIIPLNIYTVKLWVFTYFSETYL